MFLILPETQKSFKKNMHTLYKKCFNENKKIVPENLPEIMNAGEAAWLIMSAKCKTAYLDSAQKEEAEGIYSDIGQKYYQGSNGIEQSDFFAMDFNGQAHLNFIVTREALLQIISSDLDYSEILESKSSMATDIHAYEPENIKLKRSTTLVRAALDEWVKSLILSTSCDTYNKFKDLMTKTYIQEKPIDKPEKLNDGTKVRDAYCVLNKEKKHFVYFNIENELGELGPLNTRSLSSFKRIFDRARRNLK